MAIKLGILFDALASEFPEARLRGDPELLIASLSPLETASSHSLAFLSHPKYDQKMLQSQATKPR